MTEEQAIQLLADTASLIAGQALTNDLLQAVFLAALVLSGVALGCTVILLLAVMFK